MSDAWLRRLVILAISLLVIYQMSVWIYAAFGAAAGIVSAAVVAAVSFLSARMARLGGAGSAWFLVPTLLFTIVPLGAKFWSFVSAETSWWSRAVEFVPFLVGFAFPVCLLLVVYVELRNRSRSS